MESLSIALYKFVWPWTTSRGSAAQVSAFLAFACQSLARACATNNSPGGAPLEPLRANRGGVPEIDEVAGVRAFMQAGEWAGDAHLQADQESHSVEPHGAGRKRAPPPTPIALATRRMALSQGSFLEGPLEALSGAVGIRKTILLSFFGSVTDVTDTI